MKIILAELRHPFPGRTAEAGAHVVGILSLHAVPPYIIIVIGIVLTLLRLKEPGMLIRGMVQHQIQNDPDAVLLSFRDQLLHIGQGSKEGIDVPIVRNIIAVVVLRRTANRGKPYGVDSQLLQIVQLSDDSLQVSHSASRAVTEAAGINLINDRVLPPFFLSHICLFSCGHMAAYDFTEGTDHLRFSPFFLMLRTASGLLFPLRCPASGPGIPRAGSSVLF